MVIPLSLLMAIAALARAPRKLLAVGFTAIIVAMLCGAALGTYHAGVEWHLWAGPTDCSGPITDLNAKGSILGQLNSIHVVRCDEAAWRLLGISLAGYNVLISLALAAIAGYGLLASRRHGVIGRRRCGNARSARGGPDRCLERFLRARAPTAAMNFSAPANAAWPPPSPALRSPDNSRSAPGRMA